MKKILSKTLLFTLAFILTFGSVYGCSNSGENITEYTGPLLPDYSTTEGQFEFFAYRGLTDGSHTLDGKLIMPEEEYKENFDSVKACNTYKEAGFTIMMVGGKNSYLATDTQWEGSNCQIAMKKCYEAGIDKIIIGDARIGQYINHDKQEMCSLFPDGNGGFDQQAFNEKIKGFISTYYQADGFYGLSLGDEPKFDKAFSYGVVYKAVKNAAKELGMDDIYIHINFLPIDTGGLGSERFQKTLEDGTALTFEQSYRKYIEDFLISTEADRISVDIYFFRASGYYPGTFANLQILRELCDKYNAKLTFCLQSFEMWNGENPNYSKMDKVMMRSEIETCIGMGIDHFAYYTYNVDPESSSTGTKSMEESCFVNFKGEKNPIYYFGQEVMSEAKKLEKVILNYKFLGSNMYTAPVAKFNNSPYITSNTEIISKTVINYKRDYQFALIKDFAKDFTCDNDVAFITELKDEKNDLYMYMVQNVIDPRNSQFSSTDENVSVNFGSEYKYIAEFDGGNLTYHNLDNGVYKRVLTAGQAVYLIPLK